MHTKKTNIIHFIHLACAYFLEWSLDSEFE